MEDIILEYNWMKIFGIVGVVLEVLLLFYILFFFYRKRLIQIKENDEIIDKILAYNREFPRDDSKKTEISLFLSTSLASLKNTEDRAVRTALFAAVFAAAIGTLYLVHFYSYPAFVFSMLSRGFEFGWLTTIFLILICLKIAIDMRRKYARIEASILKTLGDDILKHIQKKRGG